MDHTLTQNQSILEHLKEHGTITPIEALNLYGCMRCASRISELKAMGFNIETEMITSRDTGKRFARYTLLEVAEE